MNTDNLLLGNRQIHRVFLMCGFRLFVVGLVHAQEKNQLPETNDYDCGMKKAELDPLIEEAERNQFMIRRIEIVGSTYTRYQEFNKRMATSFHEGYYFARKTLEESLRRISRMKTIYPVGMEDIEIRVDRESKDVDIIFCVKQKPKKG